MFELILFMFAAVYSFALLMYNVSVLEDIVYLNEISLPRPIDYFAMVLMVLSSMAMIWLIADMLVEIGLVIYG